LSATGRPGTGEAPGWLVLREGRVPRWGGEIRRRHVFSRLAARTGATILEDGWSDRGLRRATLGPLAGRLPVALGRRVARSARPRFAASEKLREAVLRSAVALTDPAVVAVYDDPLVQAATIGIAMDRDWLATLASRQRANVEAFRWLVVPTASFAELARLPADRVIVGGNGTDTSAVRVGPWPSRPTVGVVSAAAPGRGLELLVEAARLARRELPDLELRLWLVATNDEGRAYLDGLRATVGRDPWVRIATAPYDRLGETLAEASALAIPHPPGAYMDVALPVKLFDSLAAGRPLVVTPRRETAAIVEGLDVGVVAGGDAASDLAAAIAGLLADEARTRAAGERARAAAESTFDWRVVGDRIADEVLRREGVAEPADAAGGRVGEALGDDGSGGQVVEAVGADELDRPARVRPWTGVRGHESDRLADGAVAGDRGRPLHAAEPAAPAGQRDRMTKELEPPPGPTAARSEDGRIGQARDADAVGQPEDPLEGPVR
jgi:glycosyltransferase involved in cell wall biosynthesis